MRFLNCHKPVMIIDDDEIDIIAVKRAFKILNIQNDLISARSGIDALNLLKKKNFIKPCLIFLDLNMPEMNGIEFVGQIKKINHLKHIPIIILTSSNQTFDSLNGIRGSIAGFYHKPEEHAQLVDIIHNIHTYWSYGKIVD